MQDTGKLSECAEKRGLVESHPVEARVGMSMCGSGNWQGLELLKCLPYDHLAPDDHPLELELED